MSDPHPHFLFAMKHRLGALELDASFELTQPWTILFGPSGSGKSTILRAIAGLVQPRDAKIILDLPGLGRQVAVDTSNSIFLKPQQRFVRWSAQRPALFPNMTVRENLRFVASKERPRADTEIDSILQRFHLTHLAERSPAMLSGGEQQRSAIARVAAASAGHLLLLDEPFSGLDASLRDELLADLQIWAAQTKTPILSVTHDISEAFQLDAEVLKLCNGRIVAQGHAAVVLVQERSRLLAQLADRL